jgi:hypothetical protein
MDFKEYIPGFLQGVTRVCISYPFDYIRIFLQINNKDKISTIFKTNNLYSGLFIPLISVPIDRAITFRIYELLKNNNKTPLECALYPSVISSVYMTPINIINYNYIYYKQPLFITIRKSFKTNIYRGNIVELTRNMCSSTLFLMSYNYLSKNNANYPVINGSISSIIMWSILYPLDTIKTKKFIENKRYIDIFKETNFLHYYRGFSMVALKSIPSAGVGMFVYEKTKTYIWKSGLIK